MDLLQLQTMNLAVVVRYRRLISQRVCLGLKEVHLITVSN